MPIDARASAAAATAPAPASASVPPSALARIETALAAIAGLRVHAAAIDRIGTTIATAIERGGTLYTAGNGGSAAEAMHLAEELIGRFRGDRPPLRAISLVSDPTALTCIANDFGFEDVFARQCEALCRAGDVLVVFSTSGRSPNIVRAAETARRRGATVIGLLGGGGGDCRMHCTEALVIDGADSAAIQEAHQVVLHAICERCERLAPESSRRT